jgi:GH25 family lysozyme M1 (1,4-beta-N-acetylmuramidase)
MRKIIDISSWQGFVNWGHVKVSAGIDGFVQKAVDGLNEDTTYDFNRRRAEACGMPLVGCYGWYYAPSTTINGITQAEIFLATIGKGVLPIPDFEVKYLPSCAADFQAYLNVLDTAWGSPVPLYTGAETLISCLQLKDGSYPTWITNRKLFWAEYPNRKNWLDQWNINNYTFQAVTNIPKALQTNLWMWQFNKNGVIPGIPGNSVDLDFEINPLVV